MPACPPAAGTPSSNTSAIPLMPPGSPTAPEPAAVPLRHPAVPSRCDAGDSRAAGRLAARRRRRLHTRADAADSAAARRLAGLLAKRGDLEGLRTRPTPATIRRRRAGRTADYAGQGEEAERCAGSAWSRRVNCPVREGTSCLKSSACPEQHGESDAACLSLIVSRIERYLELLLHAVP